MTTEILNEPKVQRNRGFLMASDFLFRLLQVKKKTSKYLCLKLFPNCKEHFRQLIVIYKFINLQTSEEKK